MVPPEKFAERQIVCIPDEPVDQQAEKFDEGGGKTNVEELDGVPQEYDVDSIVCHIGKGNTVW